jgi:hypothetical protein
MTDVSDDNLGRRLFQLQKEKAVEDAMEKIRRRTGTDRHPISTADNEILTFILGELWTSIDRHRWGSYSFTKLSEEDLRALVIQGRGIKNKHTMTDDDIKALDSILNRSI